MADRSRTAPRASSPENPAELKKFRKIVFTFYLENGRHELPWRKTTDAYKILVSEVMLQQTQVERVIPYYEAWLEKFPTVKALAAAPLGDVLRAWQGLGYNRRAKMLHEAAKVVVKDHKGKMPHSIEELVALPGIGPYTARAVLAFADNQDVVFIETNLRTVVLHHFFPNATEPVSDKEILAVLERAFPEGKAREWYAALMDYGSHLKRSGVRTHIKAKAYARQSTFSGSNRQARGAILKALTKGPQSKTYLTGLLGPDRRDQLEIQLAALTTEGMIERNREKYHLPN